MRKWLIAIALSIFLSRASLGVDLLGDAPKQATAHFLSLMFSAAMHATWPEDNPFEGVATWSEDDPPAPSPSPSVVARLGDRRDPLWLIPPTKSPSASPGPSVSPASQPPVAPEDHCDSIDRAEDVFSDTLSEQNIFDVSMLLELLGDAFGAQAAELILEMAQAEDAPRSAIIDQVSEVLLIANDAAKMQARTLLVSLAQLNHSCHERVIRDAIYALLSGNVRAEKEAAVILFTLTQSGQASPGERESTAAMIEDPSVQAVVPEPLEEQAEYREEEHPPTPPIQPVIASYFAMNNTEVPINSVFAQWVSVQLSGMSNGLTPEVRAGLLALARSRSASLLERVAAAGFLHLNDEGECKAEAASILSDLAPPVCEHRYAIAEHVRKVLRAHHALAEDLIVELENVVAQSNTSIAIDRDPMINNCNERTKAHPRRAPRKRKVDCVASEPVSNKAPRRVEDDVCAARERRGPTEAERRCVKAGREKGERDEISKKTLDEDALRVSYVTTKIGKLYPELFDLYWRAYERGNDAARQKYGTPAQRAAVLGKRYEFRSGKRSVTYPSVDDVKAQYHAEFDEAAEAEVDAHAYKAEHERAQWTPEQLADHLGKKNGGASARKGFKFSTDTSLRRWYKKRYFHATEAEVNAYVSAYKAEYSRVFLADSMM